MKNFNRRINGIKRHTLQKSELIMLLALLFYVLGCSYLKPVTYYDPTTFKNLTDLKPKVISLYETFTGDSVNTDFISSIRLELFQIYEYEKGKGEKNIGTYQQIKLMQSMFERHVNERIQSGKWSKTHLENQKKSISEAFDIAIKTERLKNKNE
jgi:hypothetical protein